MEDVLQDVAERFLSRTPSFATTPDALAWAKAVARHRLIDLSRRPDPNLTADLDLPTTLDAEQRALDRVALDCARQFLSRIGIDEAQLLGDEHGPPLTAQERMSRTRWRRQLRAHLKNKVGWPVFIPRWRWLTPAIGALIMIPLPYLSDHVRPDIEPAPAPHQTGVEPEESSPQVSGDPGQLRAREIPTSPGGIDAASPDARPGEPIIGVPTPWGEAEVGREPAPEGGPAPLFCAEDLRITDDLCVSHPLREP